MKIREWIANLQKMEKEHGPDAEVDVELIFENQDYLISFVNDISFNEKTIELNIEVDKVEMF